MTQLAATRYPGTFAPESFWATRITDKTAITNSSSYVDYLIGNIEQQFAYINSTTFTNPIYVVPEDQPLVPVPFNADDQVEGHHATLEGILEDGVPVPTDARASTGTDQNMCIWQPSTDRYWDFWHMRGSAGSWTCGYAGYMGEDFHQPVSEWDGYFPDPGDALGGLPDDGDAWGGSGSGLPLMGGTMRGFEIGSGVIPHALQVSLGEFSGGVFVDNGTKLGKKMLPATRSDGKSTDPFAPPEGMRFTLPDNYDESGLPYYMTRLIAAATRDFSFVVSDGGGNAITFYAEDTKSMGGANPYSGASGFFQGQSPVTLLTGFPWDQLIVLDGTIVDD